MAYQEKTTSKDISRLIASLMLLFIAGGSFAYLVARFGPNPMALRQSVTMEEILNPAAEVNRNEVVANGQVAGESDKAQRAMFAVKTINMAEAQPGENTVEIARIQNVPFLRMNNTIIAPQAGFDVSAVNLSDAANYPWKQLVTMPQNAEASRVFSFYVSPDTVNVGIVMQSTIQNKPTQYNVYVYNELNGTAPLRRVHTFLGGSSEPSIPRVSTMSADGRYLTLSLYSCEDCVEVPVSIMIDSVTGVYQSIGKTSQIVWGAGGDFQYKVYEEAECPDKTVAAKCTVDPQYLEFKTGSVK